MDVFLARQPINDKNGNLSAYELLYRKDENNHFSDTIHGDEATYILVSDAIMVFGINNLTNGMPAFINFTKKLLMEDFALLMNPKDVVIEVLEDIIIDDEIIKKISELKSKNYVVAIDDYIGEENHDLIIDYVDIIKVDFAAIDEKKIVEIAERFLPLGKTLLAEKVETEEQFYLAVNCGYELFQGFYFAKPKMIKAESIKLDISGYISVVTHLNKFEPDFKSLADAIRKNPKLTYRLLQYINTHKLENHESIDSIQMALVTMGLNEVRRWILLVIAREFSQNGRDEMIKLSFIRGLFAEKLMARDKILGSVSHEAFTMGVFSMMDTISGLSKEEILGEIPLHESVKEALLGKQNQFKDILDFVIDYENANWEKASNLLEIYGINRDEAVKMYLECIVYADFLLSKNPTLKQN